MSIDFKALAAPFPSDAIEWRLQSSGKGQKGIWAKVVAYINNRAIMDRLDEVVGPANWKDEFKPGPEGGVACGLSIRVGDEWVTKWDGAENTAIEKVKGGFSASEKRAAVKWGIGRYLYDLPEGWAAVGPKGAHYAKLSKRKGDTSPDEFFNWDPPMLPEWARPAKEGGQLRVEQQPQTNGAHHQEPEREVTYTPDATQRRDRGMPGDEASPLAKIKAQLRNSVTQQQRDGYLKASKRKVSDEEYTELLQFCNELAAPVGA